MAREWRRLLVEPARLQAANAEAAPLPLQPEEAHYLRRVLRLRLGDQLAVVDGAGHLWSARLEECGAGSRPAQALRLEQPLQAPLQQQAAAGPQLHLAVALPRLDADVLLRMVCELGIDRFTPLSAGRSVAADRLKPQRQQAIVREALEQCERLWLPQLQPEQEAAAWLGRPAPPSERRYLATTRREGLMLLERGLAQLLSEAAAEGSVACITESITVAIGPEGGWTAAEEETALAAGWQPVGLGEAILRTSTAAVTAAALMLSWRRRLSCGTSPQPSP